MKKQILCIAMSILMLTGTVFAAAPTEADFRVVWQDSRGRYLVEKDKFPPGTVVPEGKSNRLFGMVDSDMKTVLLPLEYEEEPWIDIGNKGRSWVPHWYNGYMILKKGGKCGVVDYNLNVVVPFQYDELTERLYNAVFYKKGESHGVIFLDTGRIVPDGIYPSDTPHTLTMQSPDESIYSLYNRYGDRLYQTRNQMRVDREPTVTVNNEGFAVPAVVRKSSWSEAEISSARAAGLLPDDVDWLYTYPASRRDFCRLIVQMLETARPSAVRKSEQAAYERFWDVAGASDDRYDESPIADAAETGILSGFPDGSFRPYIQISRQDAAVMLAKAADLLGVEPQTEPIAFDDLEEADEYAREAIRKVSALQTPDGVRIMSGTAPGTFSPKGTCTIEQVMVTVYRLYQIAK